MNELKLVITAAANKAEAEELAEQAVKNRLAACVQILPQITSIYYWEGQVEKENENLLIFKTNAEQCRKLMQFIESRHSYQTPEILSLSAENVSEKYLKWLRDYLRS